MLRLMHAEWIKLRYNWVLGLMLAILCLISFILAGASFGMLPEYLTAETPQFFTGIEMSRGEHVFERVMRDVSFTSWLSLIFAPLFIGTEFTSRSMNQYIFAGHTRLKIFVVKILECYLFVCIASAIYPIVSCLRYSLPWLIQMEPHDVAYVLRCIGMRVVLDMAIMNISIIATFALKDFIRPIVASLVATLVVVQFLGIRYSLDPASVGYKILSFYPSYQYSEVMRRTATNEQILVAIYSAGFFIVLTVGISYCLFRRAELS
ncbi:MAG: hypothetical protein ACRCTE_00280 [Cellulosilyticaceae bacterium]